MGSLNVQQAYQPRELFSIASFLLAGGKYEDLIRICRKMRDLNPSMEMDCYCLEIEALLNLNKTSDSVGLLKEAESRHSGEHKIDDCYGRICIKEGDYKSAERHYLQAIKKTDKSMELANYKYILGGVYLKRGNYKESLEYAIDSIKDNPGNWPSFKLLTDIAYYSYLIKLFNSYFFVCFAHQIEKYCKTYPPHKITRLDGMFLHNNIIKGWNKKILSFEDNSGTFSKMDKPDWIKILQVDFGPVYARIINSKNDNLIIQSDPDIPRDSDCGYDLDCEMDYYYEEEEEDESLQTDEEYEEYNLDVSRDSELDETSDDEALIRLFDSQSTDVPTNMEFILALLYLARIPLSRANELYFMPTRPEMSEANKMNWANGIMEMIYDLKYKYQSNFDRGAQESIERIKAAAAVYLDREMADGVINQILRLVDSIIIKGNEDSVNNGAGDYFSLN